MIAVPRRQHEPAADRPAWAGWYRRPGGTWRRLVEAESQDEAWGMLFAQLEDLTGDWAVLPAGRHPQGDGRSTGR